MANPNARDVKAVGKAVTEPTVASALVRLEERGCDREELLRLLGRLHHARPHTLDIVPVRGPNRGRVVPGIVSVAGGSMRICCDLSGRCRPAEFTSPAGTRRFLAPYRRVA